MNLKLATRWSLAIASELSPLCHRLEVAGSIRRHRTEPGDIDIVCIPKRQETKDLLGSTVSTTNAVLEWSRSYAEKCKGQLTGPGDQVPRIISGGEREGKQLILQLRKCQLDLWFATEANFATRLLMRTGSKEHNIWLATRLTERGMHWFPYEGITTLEALRAANINPSLPGAADQAVSANLIMPAGTESDLYGYAGIDLIAPENRELPWLAKHIDSGL